MSRRDEILNQYLRFANDVNHNISNMIHLTNNLRYNTFQLCNHHLDTHFLTNDIFFPPVSAPPPPPPIISPATTRRRRPRLRRTVTTRYIPQNQGLPTPPLLSQSRSHPSSNQINQATESFLYSDISTNNVICPISRQTFEPTTRILRIRHCKHIFCETSLRQWFQTSYECPICRYDIRGQNRSISSMINNILEQSLLQRDLSGNIFNNDISGNTEQFEYSFSIERAQPS